MRHIRERRLVSAFLLRRSIQEIPPLFRERPSVLHHQAALHPPAEVLVHRQVFLHHIPGGGGQHPDLAVFLHLFQCDVQKRLEVVVVVLLHCHGIKPFGVQGLAVQRQGAEGLLAADQTMCVPWENW